MYKNIFFILFILLPFTISAQKDIQVYTTYNKAEKGKELTVELVNKTDAEIGIFNMKYMQSEYISYFELYFFDKNEQIIPVSYFHSTFGIPFMNALDIPKVGLIFKSNNSLTFKYSIERLFQLCKEPDKIKEMKLKFHIEYVVSKECNNDKQCVFEEFSKAIRF